MNPDLINTLYQCNYTNLSKCSINFKDYKVITLEKLLLLKTLDAVRSNNSKSKTDQKKIVDHIINNNYNLCCKK